MVELSARDTNVAGLPLSKYAIALTSSLLVSGHVCIYGFTVTSTRASGQYFMWFDSPTLPADGVVPINGIDIASNTGKGVSWLASVGEGVDIGREFFTGFALCNSTTLTSKTIGSSDCLFDVQYVVLD